MKKVTVVIAVVLLASIFAMGQEEKAQVFGGYQFTSIGGSGLDRTSVPKGWDADLAVKATRNFGVVADFSGAYKDGTKDHTFMFGPRATTKVGKLSPFAEALFGGANINNGVGTKFSMAFGGGLDVDVAKNVAFRLAKFDYNLVRIDGSNLNNFRYATGVVFKF